VIEVQQTPEFSRWFTSLRDFQAKQRIHARITRLEGGLFGDVKALINGICELRIDYGPGYRLYFDRRGKTIMILLCGGDKSTQERDIAKALTIAKEV
jgi:putative addiction module killer protein